jgi:aspartate-semialdehyde dehydrogenase
MKEQLELAIIGAGGLLGETLLTRLAQHPRLSVQITLLGGDETLGQVLEFGSLELNIDDIFSFDFNRVKVVIDTGDELLDREWLERSRTAGCIVLDIGSHLLNSSDLPPVVASVNPQVLAAITHGGIITIPDAATTQLTTLLKPIVDRLGVQRVSVFSFHATSDLGRSGVEELVRQTAQLLNGKPVQPLLFPAQIAFNLVPLVGTPDESRMTQAEQRILDQTKRILGLDDLELLVTCSWSPVFFGHSQAISLQTKQPITVAELHELLAGFSDIEVIQASDSSPTAVTHASGKDALTVGRVRLGQQNTTEFSLWTVADNLQFGIAGNLVRVLEILVKDYL